MLLLTQTEYFNKNNVLNVKDLAMAFSCQLIEPFLLKLTSYFSIFYPTSEEMKTLPMYYFHTIFLYVLLMNIFLAITYYISYKFILKKKNGQVNLYRFVNIEFYYFMNLLCLVLLLG